MHDRTAPLHRSADRLQPASQGHPAPAGRRRAGRLSKLLETGRDRCRHHGDRARGFPNASTSRRCFASASCWPFRPVIGWPASTSCRSQAIDGEIYLRRVNCEYWDHLVRAMRRRMASSCTISYSSEREDWIQNMVAGGLGICFLPEYSAVIPGLQVRAVTEPEVVARDLAWSPSPAAGSRRRSRLSSARSNPTAGPKGATVSAQPHDSGLTSTRSSV